MVNYVGDGSRMIFHRVEDLQDACLENNLDLARVTEIHSKEFLDYLVKSEKWHSCPHCNVAHSHAASAHTHFSPPGTGFEPLGPDHAPGGP